MYSKYFCSICKTSPDQRSHHNAHLNTQKHKENRATYIRNMKIFSHQFRQINPLKWEESPEEEYISKTYFESTFSEPNFLDVKQWIMQQGLREEYNYDGWCDKSDKIFKGCSIDEYYKTTGITISPKFDFEDTTQLDTYIAYSNWAINKIVEYKETMCEKPKKHSHSNKVTDTKFRIMLSKHTNVKLNTLNSVRQGEIELEYLLEPPLFDLSVNNKINIELYNDQAVKYACLLFENTGIWHMCFVYDGYGLLDSNEVPEARYDQTFYFHKQVEILHKQIIEGVSDYKSNEYIETKKIWVSCDMHKICGCYDEDVYSNTFKYLTNDDFKCIIKERLGAMYQKKIDNLAREIEIATYNFPFYIKNGRFGLKPGKTFEDFTMDDRIEYDKIMDKFEYIKKHYTNEKNMFRDLSLSSKLLEDIVKICEYLFEYNEELIEYYKNFKPIIYSSRFSEPESD